MPVDDKKGAAGGGAELHARYKQYEYHAVRWGYGRVAKSYEIYI